MPSAARLSQFGPAIAWLLSRDVSANRLADLFGTTAANIRVIVFRSRHGEFGVAPTLTTIDTPFTQDQALGLGVRPGRNEVVVTPADAKKTDVFRELIQQTAQKHAAQYDFQAGIKTLRSLIPKVGYPAESARLAVSALLHQNIAWLLVHAGSCMSASTEAAIACDLWRAAHFESPCREYADGFVQAALIGSNALLLQRLPERALGVLDLARAAAESVAAPIGSEHFRQRGVALLQMRQDEAAAKEFRSATIAMEKFSEARVQEQIRMTGARHLHLLGSPDWEGAQELASTAERAFGANALESAMAINWAAACALVIDSPVIMQGASDLLAGSSKPSSQFGHQMTVRKLLAITPSLGFDARLRGIWVRRALYENAFARR